MRIEKMGDQQCLDALARFRFGRLCCARDDQPYIVPVYFAYHDRHLYSFSMDGRKIQWMRTNPKACVEADEITSPVHWLSVLVEGRYEELPDTPDFAFERSIAYDMLRQRAGWWDPASIVSPPVSGAEAPAPVLYRIHIDEVTGHRAVPNPAECAVLPAYESAPDGGSNPMLRMLRRALIN